MSASSSLMRYQIMEALGSGAQGSTFRAIDRQTQQEVAVKVFQLKNSKGGWKAFDRFEQECKLLKSLHHPGIPRFIESFASEDSGDFFLVMELIKGESLDDQIKQRTRPDLEQVKDLFDQALQILRYLHHHTPTIIHRDIKPANLLISSEANSINSKRSKLWLIDFGGVKVISSAAENNFTAIGTFGYMAPEQLHGQAKAASDVYSLAASFTAYATGIEGEKLPRKGLTIDLSHLLEPSRFRDLLEKMLVPEPELRLSNIDLVWQEFRQLSTARPAGHTGRSGPADPVHPPHDVGENPSISTEVAQRFAIPVTALAKVKSPAFRLLLWIVASLAAGVLTLAEAFIVPVVFAIWERGNASKNSLPDNQGKLKKNRLEIERSIRESRQALQYLTQKTHPLHDKNSKES